MKSKITQSDLAACIGVSFQQVQKYEQGRNRISASMLYEMANCLNTPVSKFFEGLPEPSSERSQPIVADVDERIAYISTAGGKRLVDHMLLLTPRVRSRVVLLVGSLVDNE